MGNFLKTTMTTKRKLKIEQIKDTNIYAYWDEYDIELNGKRTKEKTFGITSFENLKNVKDLEAINLKISNKRLLNEYGYVFGIKKEELNNLFSGKKHVTKVITRIDEEKYKSNDYELVIWNQESFKILDLYGNFISLPFKLGNTYGLNDSKFNIQKLLNILKNDINVCERDDLKITEVPYDLIEKYFNVKKQKSKSIEFYYLLPTDIYQNLMELEIHPLEVEKYIINNIMDLRKALNENDEQ